MPGVNWMFSYQRNLLQTRFCELYKDGSVKRMTLLEVRLARDSMSTPWGFRLQGGYDVNQPLVVQRVFANSPSERELQRGDLIVAIGGRETTHLTHKQAQDAISKGGGQIELLVTRPPPGKVNIKPLSPTKDTRAPTFPQSPTKAPQIVIPIQTKSGPQSPRYIPVSPQKPSPQPSPRSAPSQPSMSAAAGHIPTKITLNKYGGGGMDFGYSPSAKKAPHASSYRPVAAPVAVQVPVRDQPDYGSHTQFSAPQQQFSPPAAKSEEERGVAEEEYGSITDRRRQFMKGAPQAPNYYDDDDYDYPTAPVYERKKLFGKGGNKRQPPPKAVNRSRKPLPTYGRPAYGEEPVTYGLDFSKPQPKPVSKPTKTRARPPAVNARRDDDETDQSWSNTLRGERNRMKPWEIEAMEMEKYQGGTVDQPYRPSMAPAPAPKPKITQITAQSRANPPAQDSSGARSVSPYYAPANTASRSSRSPVPPSQYSPNAYANDVTGGHGRQQHAPPNIVHLQYNSPMGLYSQDNIQDAYIGQTQNRSHAPPQQQQQQQQQQQKQPVPIGERDWSNSYVYQMVHSSKSTTSQDGPDGGTVTHTRVTEEKKYPGQEPQKTVTETVSRGAAPDYTNRYRDAEYGISDF